MSGTRAEYAAAAAANSTVTATMVARRNDVRPHRRPNSLVPVWNSGGSSSSQETGSESGSRRDDRGPADRPEEPALVTAKAPTLFRQLHPQERHVVGRASRSRADRLEDAAANLTDIVRRRRDQVRQAAGP